MKPLGAGEDNVAYLAGDDLVVRFRRADPGAVVQEAVVLRAVAAVSPIAVPVPELVDPVRGCLTYRKLPGVPLLTVAERDEVALGRRLGQFLEALHTLSVDAPVDDTPPAEWRDEAVSLWPSVRDEVPEERRDAVREFLAAAPPEPARSLVFSHQDLGIEHVLVDAGSGEITGVIDWSDAAVGDPARDLGLILRDLGWAAFDEVRGAADLRERALFYARCGLIADLAYGHGLYREKSLAGLSWLFSGVG